VYNFAHISVGEQASVSQGTYLCSAAENFEDPSMPLVYRPISIGAQSWIAANCFVGPGVVVGEGAVVGAHSVVVKDVPAWMVVAGNPARVIRQRRLKSKLAARDPQ